MENNFPTNPEIPEQEVFMDRELSWLKFNLRVLKEASDERVPLMERFNFLTIYNSNMDEFFMVRVGSLLHKQMAEPDVLDPKTGWNAAQQIKNILAEVQRQQTIAEEVYKNIVAGFEAAGIDILNFRDLNKAEESIVNKMFEEVRYLLSPMVIDARHPFPFLLGKESYVAVQLNPKEKKDKNDKGKNDKNAKTEKPAKEGEGRIGLIGFAEIPKYRSFEINGRSKIVIMSELIRHFAAKMFKGYSVKNACTIRLCRNADMLFEMTGDEEEDFRRHVEISLKKRGRQQPVRLQVYGKPSPQMIEILKKGLGVPGKHVMLTKTPIDISFGGLIKTTSDMKYEPHPIARTVNLKKGEYIDYLQKKDILLAYPYQSIAPFIDMLYEAADDPDVISIKITLYRIASNSRLASALAYAAERGKDVQCMLELRARFDEQNNIDYSKVLQNAGCTIYYGLPGMKVHCKVCLITRMSDGELNFITQIGTGNYNEKTSELYTDLSVITSDKQIGQDATQLFQALSTGQTPPPGEKLFIAPDGYKPKVMALLDREIVKGSRGYVFIKANGLNDFDVMNKLIECSKAGVKVELVIRGICCLIPGIPGETENISVRSIIGRHLEHSRIYVFGTDEERRVFVGSGDLLSRNTTRRVEVFTEITSPDILEQVLDLKQMLLDDHEKSWVMGCDGNYVLDKAIPETSSQELSYRYFSALRVDALPKEEPQVVSARRKEAPETEGAGGFAGFLRKLGFKK